MTRNRKILLVVFIVVSVFGMWARYYNEKQRRLKMEDTLRSLATYQSAERAKALLPAPAPTPDDRVDEPRDMFDSTLPDELLEHVRQKVGQDFKLMELVVDEDSLDVKVSTDGASVQSYQRPKDRKTVEGPAEVKLIGDGKLGDSLYDPKLVNLSLIPKLAKEAAERAALPNGKVETARFNYPFIRYKGEGPEWNFVVYANGGDGPESKFVVFDAKGKFKKTF
ncbi:MAG TPA: hypothetical protein VGX48_19100 [Pyrinomonadaceae bacterium]|nr:hypothetical protein [Pyrinomonadaceae bacterium]